MCETLEMCLKYQQIKLEKEGTGVPITPEELAIIKHHKEHRRREQEARSAWTEPSNETSETNPS